MVSSPTAVPVLPPPYSGSAHGVSYRVWGILQRGPRLNHAACGKCGMSRCEQADYTVNFLSVAYVKSDACVEEWCFSRCAHRIRFIHSGTHPCFR